MHSFVWCHRPVVTVAVSCILYTGITVHHGSFEFTRESSYHHRLVCYILTLLFVVLTLILLCFCYCFVAVADAFVIFFVLLLILVLLLLWFSCFC